MQFLSRCEHAGDNFFSGKGGEGKRLDELLGGAGHDDLHTDATILQQANDFGCLVSCDAASDAQSDLHGFLIVDFRLTIQRQKRAVPTRRLPIQQSSILPEALLESLGSLLCGGSSLWNFPLDLAGADLVLRDAAGLAGIGIDYGRCTRLELPGAAGCDQNVPVVAIETFNQLHWDVPLET